MHFFNNIPLFEMFVFSFVILGSPGPLNMVMLVSTTRIGFKRTLPFIIGSPVGLIMQTTALAFGLGQFFELYPVSKTIISIVGSLYLIYLAQKVYSSTFGTDTAFKPVSFIQGMLMSLSNPKSLINGSLGISLFVPIDNYINGAIAFICIFSSMALIANTAWGGLGKLILKFLSTPKRQKIFSGTLSLFILLVVVWMNAMPYVTKNIN